MKNKLLYTIIINIFGCICFSCNSFLSEQSQDQAYVRSYSDLDELLAGSVYMKSHYVDYDYAFFSKEIYYPYIHYMADETQISTTGQQGYTTAPNRLFGYYTWQQEVGKDHENSTVWKEEQDWQNLYNYINITNLILSLINEQKVTTISDQENVNRIKGESHFLRGAYYFTLANLYGKPYSPATASSDLAVPLKLTEYIEDKTYSRASVEAVYEQVLKDLLAAEKYFKDIPSKSVIRAGHSATCLLLSRVYLYMQNYKETMTWAKACLEECPHLINLNTFTGEDFLTKTSPELIFTMGSNHLPINITAKKGEFEISKDLYDCYEPGDLRAQHFVALEEGHYLYKKTHFASGNINISDNFAFRSAEAYLNLAEAAACLGGEYTTEALNAYNTLKQNRMTPETFTREEHLSGESLVNAIRQERRKELCLEGHRWFDLRRYMVNDLYPYEKTLTNIYTVYEYSYTSYSYELTLYRKYSLPPHDGAWTLPIPLEELNSNYGMPNNERGVRNYESLL